MNWDDASFIRRFGQEAERSLAFYELVQQFQEPLYWHIRRLVLSHEDTDDVLQDTFMKAYQGLAKFRGEAQIKTWLYRIATHEALNFLERKKKRAWLSFDDPEQKMLGKLTQESLQDLANADLMLQRALLKLPAKQRLVFQMKYFDEMKYEEMSEILGTSVGALKASYHLAVKKITQFIQQT